MKGLVILLAVTALCVLVQSKPTSRQAVLRRHRWARWRRARLRRPRSAVVRPPRITIRVGNASQSRDNKVCFRHFGPGKDLNVEAGQYTFDMRSEHCRQGYCNVLPIDRFRQTSRRSKLLSVCRGRTSENYELCKAIRNNNCVADSSGTLQCSTCCAGPRHWLDKWHVLQDHRRNQVRYRVHCDKKHGYTYDIQAKKRSGTRFVRLDSSFTGDKRQRRRLLQAGTSS